MANKKRLIPLQKRIIYAGDVFNSLMSEKRWSATEAVTDNNVGSKWIPVSERLPEVVSTHKHRRYTSRKSFSAFVCKRAASERSRKDTASGTTITQNPDGGFRERLILLPTGCPFLKHPRRIDA